MLFVRTIAIVKSITTGIIVANNENKLVVIKRDSFLIGREKYKLVLFFFCKKENKQIGAKNEIINPNIIAMMDENTFKSCGVLKAYIKVKKGIIIIPITLMKINKRLCCLIRY